MTPKEAQKVLKDLGWTLGESFKRRPVDEQKQIRKATHALAAAGISYTKKPANKAKKPCCLELMTSISCKLTV